jgi:positive regulator of sigma E activity
MKTMARVLEVTDERARLGCDSIAQTCSACSGGCLLRRLAPGEAAKLEVPRLDSLGVSLETGARVTVEVGGRDLMGAAVRAALLPLTGALAGPLLLRTLAADLAASDGITVLAATVGLFFGWTAARLWLRHRPPHVVVLRDQASFPSADGEDAL